MFQWTESESHLDMASAHVVGSGWYSDRQTVLSSLDIFFELENSLSLDMFDVYSIKIQVQAFSTKEKARKSSPPLSSSYSLSQWPTSKLLGMKYY